MHDGDGTSFMEGTPPAPCSGGGHQVPVTPTGVREILNSRAATLPNVVLSKEETPESARPLPGSSNLPVGCTPASKFLSVNCLNRFSIETIKTCCNDTIFKYFIIILIRSVGMASVEDPEAFAMLNTPYGTRGLTAVL